jgi:hypothetical protein
MSDILPFDDWPSEALRAADEAVAQAEQHADDAWFEAALRCVSYLAATRVSFTTDDVWEVLNALPDVSTHEPRALGAVMRRASKQGCIEPSFSYRPSSRTECHGRPVRVWYSRLCEVAR